MTPSTKHRNAPLTIDTPLDVREATFVAEYLLDFRASRAAAAVGYKGTPKYISVQAARMLVKPHVQEAIRRATDVRRARHEVTADRTIVETARVAFSDIRRFYDEDGILIPIHTLPDDLAACIASIEVVKRNLTAGDGKQEFVYKIKLWSKPQALELLGQYLGLVKRDGSEDEGRDVPAFILPADTPGVSVH